MLSQSYALTWWKVILMIDYFLISYINQEPCLKQPLSFGVNCSLVCHCLENVCQADTDGIGCLSGSCSPGYTGFPTCQQPCGVGTFGVDCLSRCNCEPVNVCEPTNGICIGANKCSRFNYGPGCQGVRTRILSPPKVSTDCRRITITWPKYSSKTYVGSADITRFQILHRASHDKTDKRLDDISINGTSEYHYIFSPTNRSAEYTFYVKPYFRVPIPPDYYIESGVQSPPSARIVSECPWLPGFHFSTNGNVFTAIWEPYPIQAVRTVVLHFKTLSIGDCMQNEPDSTNASVISTKVEIDDLKMSQVLRYWSRYQVEAFGLTNLGIPTASKLVEIATGSRAPTAKPRNLRLLVGRSDGSATFNWDWPSCLHRHGPFKTFIVQIEPLHTDIVMRPMISKTMSPPLNISGLREATTYKLMVAFANEVGTGPFAELTTNIGVSGLQMQVYLVNRTHTDSLIIWTTPVYNHSQGELTGYLVEHWRKDRNDSRVKSEMLLPDTRQFWLANLTDDTAYVVQVYGILGNITIPGAAITFTTPARRENKIAPQLRLVHRTHETLEITWTTRGSLLPPDANVIVTVALMRSLLPVPPLFSTITRRVSTQLGNLKEVFTGLPSASEYRVCTAHVASSEYVTNGSCLAAWTSSEPFFTSPNLQFGELMVTSRSHNSITVQFPSVAGYSGGPLNGFYLVVRPDNGVRLPTPQLRQASPPAYNVPSHSILQGAHIPYFSDTWPTKPIEIGSGRYVGGYPSSPAQLNVNLLANPPLEPNITYLLFAVVQSVVDTVIEDAVADTVVLQTSSALSGYAHASTREATPALVGGLLGGVLLAIFLTFLGCLVYRCYTQRGSLLVSTHQPQKVPYNHETKKLKKCGDEFCWLMPKSYAWWSIPVDVREPRYLIIDPENGPESTLTGTWTKKDLAELFMREYTSIALGYKYSHHKGQSKTNRMKNRTQTVLPYDHNRVILRRSADSSDSDYINASFIDGYMRRRAYIAAQSPFDTPTTSDFWLMIFQRSVAQVVMLTGLVEDGMLKCCQYWPDVYPKFGTNCQTGSGDICGSSCQFGNLLIRAIDRVEHAHFTVRHFSITHVLNGRTHYLVQYHFHSWTAPDEPIQVNKSEKDDHHNTAYPDTKNDETAVTAAELFTGISASSDARFDPLAFIEFYYRVKTASSPEDGPVLVHCGTGSARTALYIAFDTLLQQATHERVVSVARVCASVNKARANMFCSAMQYMLLYDLLFEALLAGHSILDFDVLSTYRALCQKNHRLGHTYLWEQWSVLHMYTPKVDPDVELRVALAAVNANRNRYADDLDLLPSERWRPKLPARPPIQDWTGYVNAVYLDGPALRDDLILTQTPMSSTVDDFWLLVETEKISCIVDMEPFGYGIKGAVRYWPLRPGELNSEPLFEGSSDEERCNSETLSEVEDAAAARRPWCEMGNSGLQVCQVGPLTPVLHASRTREPGSSYGIYRRRLLIRRRVELQNNGSNSLWESPEKSRKREVVIFHFTGNWNAASQVPESRSATVHLLEAVRLERGTGPILIHCLDGATRSGLVAVCYAVTERMTRDHYVDLFHVIKAIKVRRRAVIGSQEQLRFVYRLLAQWIKQTLTEPLAAWSTRHCNGSLPEMSRWQWPQLIGHLPLDARTGIYSMSQLPALVVDHPTIDNVQSTLNANNSDIIVADRSQSYSLSTLYYYFQEELLNQRSTHSLRCKQDARFCVMRDSADLDTWSIGNLKLT